MTDAAWRLDAGDLAIVRQPARPILMLRLRRPRPSLLQRIAGVLGTALPLEPNTAAAGDPRVTWLSPAEWMIVGAPGLLAPLQAAIAGETAIAADVGDGRVRYRVSGRNAEDLLARCTSLDLDPRAPAAFACGQTLFAQTWALVERERPHAYLVTVDASYAAHVEAWFTEVATAFRQGVAIG